MVAWIELSRRQCYVAAILATTTAAHEYLGTLPDAIGSISVVRAREGRREAARIADDGIDALFPV